MKINNVTYLKKIQFTFLIFILIKKIYSLKKTFCERSMRDSENVQVSQDSS